MTSARTTLIIVGITGDLARRKLLPALAALKRTDALPANFHIIGMSRSSTTVADFTSVEGIDVLTPMLSLVQLDMETDVQVLHDTLEKVEQGKKSTRLFYLSVPPTVAGESVSTLARGGFFLHDETKLLLEKPFGHNGESARAFADLLDRVIDPDMLYCIDHYLFKPAVRALADRRPVQPMVQIDILASEVLGVGHRVHFYNQTGALRDVVQNHLLEVAALTTAGIHPDEPIEFRRVRALAALEATGALRAQYEGYRVEAGDPSSMTETFTSVLLTPPSGNGIPITLTTGKHLDVKRTTIAFSYADGTREVVDLEDGAHPYQYVFRDVFASDRTWFVQVPEIMEAWRIIDPIHLEWQLSSILPQYPQGSTPESVMEVARGVLQVQSEKVESIESSVS